MNKPIIIDYYSDVLCVWAWIAQLRIDELNRELKDKIEIQYYFVDVFGDVPTKMSSQWKLKAGYQGFSEHLMKSASSFEGLPINPKIWTEVKPASSANAHLVLKAIEIAYGKSKSTEMGLKFREAFFVNALDIGNLDVLYDLVETAGLGQKQVIASIHDGSAMAALMHDYAKSKQQGVKGSPSYIIDGGRQILYGNVGYRVLLANIEELMRSPLDEASWC